MPLLLNAQNLSKTYGAQPLFKAISLSVSDGDRVGLIGPNGSGKSTLLEILAGIRSPDDGEVATRKNTRLSYVAQDSIYPPKLDLRTVIEQALRRAGVAETEWEARTSETLGRAGFVDFAVEAASLSGGWRKRLAIAEALVQDPEVLLLDEPTNHLDLAGIDWLEGLLNNASFASVVVSHDRYFLENVASEMAELNRAYPSGLLKAKGAYSFFLEKKDEYLSAQAKQQDSLQNRVRTEMEWLRRGPKARSTKAKARIDKANEMIGQLSDMQARSRTLNTDIDFTASERKTKRLVDLRKVSYQIGGRTLFDNLDFAVTAGMRVGLVGPNGSGKTTLLRLICGEISASTGEVVPADSLKVVYFDQMRRLDPDVTLRRALAPDSDSVVYRDQIMHVASWASRFLFVNDQLNQPVGRLSGGERARVLIAKLMLEAADVLLLDEPTNDLDIPTLEILEENLVEFTGALVLVTHDRYMLDRVSNVVLGLDGQGGAERFADYSQWDAWQKSRKQGKPKSANSPPLSALESAPSPSPKKKLSYIDSRDYETIEQRISEAETMLSQKRALLDNTAVVTDPKRLQEIYVEVEAAQAEVDGLYARWSELEAKMV